MGKMVLRLPGHDCLHKKGYQSGSLYVFANKNISILHPKKLLF
jgi:hypothetical protein